MAGTAGASGAANDAQVQTGPPPTTEAAQALREQLADEAEQAVEVIQGKLDGVKAALAAKKAEAKALRAEADQGGEG